MNFDYFSKARILLHEQEAAWVQGNPDDWPIPRYLYPALVGTGRLELIGTDTEIAPGVQTLHSPGHTCGCMALVLRSESMPATVLAGDAVKNIAELATGEVAMSWDNAASARSIRKIRDIAGIVVPGHDRVLKVNPGEIVATTACREIITIPPGVAADDSAREIALGIEPTSRKIR
jgi:glyoxylase-like metal-dependent hydrolase (beta-lactamase superfamily II)